MLPIECHIALAQVNEVAGVAYLDSDGDLNIVSIITIPLVCLDRTEWVIGQQGNNLTQDQEGVKLNAIKICGSVLVPMREALADNLGLKWGSTLISNIENCTLWTGSNINTAFPGDGELRMVVFPCASIFGYGSVFPEVSLDNLLAALAST